MFQSLTQSNTEKSKFLGMASHDLRNPLVSINGLSHFLASGKFGSLSSTQAEMASSIFEASESMLALVNDLFDVALIETGQLSVEINEVDLHQVVKTSINLYRVTAGEKDIEIEFIEKEIPKLVNCDKRQVRRVMDNLLSNAIKFSERGTTIRVILESDNNWVFFRVADEGPGVPVDEFDKLFGSFSKTSVKPTGGESSTGLGLNICKKVMTAHGGDIFAENLPEKGAQFSVQLQKTAVC
jgi:signal transduction histidine kinase